MERPYGVLDAEYYEDRRKNRAVKYRLMRRTKEVLNGIKKYKGDTVRSLLDIGTADARMLDTLKNKLHIPTAIGLDYSAVLLHKNLNKSLHLLQADASRLPFKDNLFDVLVATAVIEHVPDPRQMMGECYRVLNDGGICILSTPDPYFEHIATKIGHIKNDIHNETFSLPDLKDLAETENFFILHAAKFMVSPIGFPFEEHIEKIMKTVGLDFLLLNQLLIGQKIYDKRI